MNDTRSRLIRQYGEIIIQSTQNFSVGDFSRMARRYEKVFNRFLPSAKDSRILDVGCGDGHFLYYLKQQGYVRAEGIEASEQRLALCRKYVTDQVHCADATEWLRDHEAQYDAVFCHHVIEHFPDESLYTFTEALVKAVRPGGRLVITTPNACTPWAGYNLFHDLTHCRLFTADSLTQLLSLYGMDASIYPEAAVAFDFPSAIRWILWRVREAWLKMAFRIDIGGIRGNQKTPLVVSPNLIAVGAKPISC